MFEKFKRKICLTLVRLKYLPRYYIVIPVLVFISSIIIRIMTGGTHIVYNALDGRGIFPGPVVYALFYYLRLLICSILMTCGLVKCKCFEYKLNSCLTAVASVLLLLFEFKLIFGGVSIILTMLFTLVSAILVLISVSVSKIQNKAVSILALIFVILQIVFFVQLISLAICI